MVARRGLRIAGVSIRPGEQRDLVLRFSETYTGIPVGIPVRVLRARRPGPVLFLTGAVHGDELNGTGIVREIMRRPPRLRAGGLVCVPVVNVYGFERHSRYLPDRRDLNRSFPGRAEGSLAERLAFAVFDGVVKSCDYGIEMHTAPVRRTNFPQVRGDLRNPEVLRLARAFGCEVILHKNGDPASLRRVATESGCPTILLEAGEPLRFEPDMIEVGVRGVHRVLAELGMVAGKPRRVRRPVVCERTVWIRASRGGVLRLQVAAGARVKRGSELARCEDVFGGERERVEAPADGVVIGLTTLPAVKPGEPVCHLALST